MTKQSINLIFDENKSKTYYVESGIPQGSPISPILFLIYIRHLFPKIRMKFNAHSPSFIDDVAIYVENKTAKQNCKEIEIIVKTAYDWAASNNVKFDDDKIRADSLRKDKESNERQIRITKRDSTRTKKCSQMVGPLVRPKIEFQKTRRNADLFCESIVFCNSEFDEIRMGSETDRMQTALFVMHYSYFGLRLRNLV